MSTDFDKAFKQVHSIANCIRRDVENTLDKTFETWETLEPSGESTYYTMKVKVDNNGHIKIKTAEKEPGKDWNVRLEEYKKAKAIVGDPRHKKELMKLDKTRQISTASKTPKFEGFQRPGSNNKESSHTQDLTRISQNLKNQIQSIANCIKKDVEAILNKNFKLFEVVEHTVSSDKKYPCYNMKIKVDGDKCLRVKASPIGSGKTWSVDVEECQEGEKMIEQKPKIEERRDEVREETIEGRKEMMNQDINVENAGQM